MVVRTYSIVPYPFRRSSAYLLIALMVLVMSWDSQRSDAAVAAGAIPQESVRLRILANSDAPRDQAVKRIVRDAVVAEIKTYAAGPQTIEQARASIRSQLPELRELVGRVLEERGFRYGYKVELGIVPFPTKIYGDRVYPAGDYEALRITLGDGRGQNWWCVLFPPLCFVDGLTGETAPDAAATAAAASGTAGLEEPKEEPEVKFFLWELLKKLGAWIGGLFG